MNQGSPYPLSKVITSDHTPSAGEYGDWLPAAMTGLDRWVVHRDKRPFDPKTCKAASTTDPTTWSTFEQAVQTLRSAKWDGLGFVFSEDDDIIGIDLDNAIDEHGNVKPWAQEIVDLFNSYTEISPSGRGLHIIARDPEHRLKQGRKVAYQDGTVELYPSKRFFTVTGRKV